MLEQMERPVKLYIRLARKKGFYRKSLRGIIFLFSHGTIRRAVATGL